MAYALSSRLSTFILSVALTANQAGLANDKIHIIERAGTLPMEEITPTSESKSVAWSNLYSAYGCVYHHRYSLASLWLRYALANGAGHEILRGRNDIVFLCDGLSGIAAGRHEAAVDKTSCDAQVLQALMQMIVGDENEALDSFKRIVLNNPTSPSLKYVQNKIREIEFAKSNDSWMTPPDVIQKNANNKFARWKSDRFPIKVYIPTDAVASKIKGYIPGEGKLLRTAFEHWQKLSNGKIQFTYVQIEGKADITCSWVSNPEDLPIKDAIGVCYLDSDAHRNITHAAIKLLTNSNGLNVPAQISSNFQTSVLAETCLHEVGHSLGLNHSSKETDLMYPRAQWPPVTAPTPNDIGALNSTYKTNVFSLLDDAQAALQVGNYKAAAPPLNKAIAANTQDRQSREAICIYLNNAAASAIHKADYAAAKQLLESAYKVSAVNVSPKIKEQILTKLHHVLLQIGNAKESAELEAQFDFLRPQSKDTAAFLDKYGLKRESIPFYEEALAKNPEDAAIKEKFCFLLVMLARDELNLDNDDEAISMLSRAKNMLKPGMSSNIIKKVMTTLRQAFLKNNRYEEADRTYVDERALQGE